MTAMSVVLSALVPLPFAVSVNPSLATVTGSTSPLTTNTVTVSPVNGVPPYTYAWAFVSGQPFTCNNPLNAITNWTTNISPGAEKTGVWQCTVTDSTPVTPQSLSVPVTLDVIRL